jgi:DNA-binding MarR family transcriptional regulator
VNDVLDSIRRIMRSMRVTSRASEKKVGLSSAQIEVLRQLSADPSISMNQLAAKTKTHQSSVSVIVSKLVERGFVKRIRAKDDARMVVLTVAPASQRILRKVPGASKDRVARALESMKPSDRKQLAELLRKLVATAGLDSDQIMTVFAEVG